MLAILAALPLFFTACEKNEVENAPAKPGNFTLTDTMLQTTETSEAKVEPLRTELSFFGKITADNNKLVEVFPVVGGTVVKVYVELGDYVKKGQVLADIRSTEVAGYEKELQDAQNDVQVAQNNLRVAQELFDGKLNTDRDVVQAKSELDKAQSQLGRIKEVYKIYNLHPNALYQVVAPLSGFIVQKSISQDMQLRSDHTNNVFDIAQIDEVWAIANVNESDINNVKLGMDAEVTTISYPDQVFKGKVDKVFNIIDPETKAMKVRIRLPNPGYLLKPEMRASIKLTSVEDGKMVAVPATSLIFDKSKHFTMLYKSSSDLETREVEVFRQVGDMAYLSAGLNAGDKVVTKNQLLIYDALND